MEEICGAPGQVVIRRRDRAGGSLRFARAAPLVIWFLGCPDAAGGCRWCGFWQPAMVQHTDGRIHRSADDLRTVHSASTRTALSASPAETVRGP